MAQSYSQFTVSREIFWACSACSSLVVSMAEHDLWHIHNFPEPSKKEPIVVFQSGDRVREKTAGYIRSNRVFLLQRDGYVDETTWLFTLYQGGEQFTSEAWEKVD